MEHKEKLAVKQLGSLRQIRQYMTKLEEDKKKYGSYKEDGWGREIFERKLKIEGILKVKTATYSTEVYMMMMVV